MYVEIQKAVNFLSGYLYNKLPRRKVSLFTEGLANFFLLKYEGHWHNEEPLKDSEYRCIKINVQGETDSILTTAASSVGLDLDEILRYLPTELSIWTNPGKVSVRVGEYGVVSVIYDGSHMDGSPHNKPPEDGNCDELKLSMNRSEGTNWVVSESTGNSSPVFQLTSPHDVQFTVGSFAATRFGSSKQKTNLAALKEIQWRARTAAEKLPATVNGLPTIRGVENLANMMDDGRRVTQPMVSGTAISQSPWFAPIKPQGDMYQYQRSPQTPFVAHRAPMCPGGYVR